MHAETTYVYLDVNPFAAYIVFLSGQFRVNTYLFRHIINRLRVLRRIYARTQHLVDNYFNKPDGFHGSNGS